MQLEDRIADLTASATGRITAIAAFAGIAGASAVVAGYDPAQATFFPGCPLYQLTGLACPGCGLTRGFHALFHGDVLTALDYNALLPVWALIIAYVWLSLVVYAIRGKGLPMWPTHPRVLWVFFIALFAFGVIRNIPVYPFTILFP
jgi:hypothetical protein